VAELDGGAVLIGALGWPGLIGIGIGLVVVIAIALLWPHFAAWSRDRRECRELARGNGLDAEQAALAWQLSRLVSRSSPLAVFVRPSLWDLAVARTGASAAEVAAIRAKLFG
jgi:hypothetical protein